MLMYYINMNKLLFIRKCFLMIQHIRTKDKFITLKSMNSIAKIYLWSHYNVISLKPKITMKAKDDGGK